jgi:dihydroneopterin aldolase
MGSTESPLVHKPAYKAETLSSRLDIQDIEVFLRLGCTQNERITAQRILVSLSFIFLNPPKACKTDRLADTLCYASLTKAIVHLTQNREIHLIEHFAQICYETLKKPLNSEIKLQVRVNKVRPPVVELKGGAHFVFGDF